MKQLEHEIVDAELHKGRNRGMAEIAIGLPSHAGEIMIGNDIADERADHLDGDFRIRSPGKAADPIGFEPRPTRRYV